ncbi:fumarylacetoacetate hydrolase family protein [Sandaracinus amylolyticus]|uniref:fumarylacetoacetate hydrolase family protein n=1 Tax=Sandaracinus amylolyticus TaxID=927083 RepID=UPI001F3B5E36|nr:fumarylacetoacetate hydrolase family protein [Sandaracinus amylolyticus]UJR79377.1 Fumarylacetoacetate hydrolase [Sandaracinus amylolyticus]
MKLATLRNGTRDGALVVVRRDGTRYAPATEIAPTLQRALDEWDAVEPALRAVADRLEHDQIESRPLDVAQLRAPLPRAYEWVDGSAYINHIVLVRKARGAQPPATLETDPLVYQGGSSDFLAPTDDIPLADVAWGCDFESEVCVILGDTPQGTTKEEAARHVRLLMLANDVTLRNLVPDELAKGFGFFGSKPATAFSPFAITPDELGDAWKDGRVHLRLRTWLDGRLVGDPEAGPEMHFSFYDLIAHITKTRAFGAGTILGSGTVSNADPARGISCLAERRMREILDTGAPSTPFLTYGNRVEIEMSDASGRSLFGRIAQTVVPFEKRSDTRRTKV